MAQTSVESHSILRPPPNLTYWTWNSKSNVCRVCPQGFWLNNPVHYFNYMYVSMPVTARRNAKTRNYSQDLLNCANSVLWVLVILQKYTFGQWNLSENIWIADGLKAKYPPKPSGIRRSTNVLERRASCFFYNRITYPLLDMCLDDQSIFIWSYVKINSNNNWKHHFTQTLACP